MCQVDLLKKENITHLNTLYKNYESKPSFVVPVGFPNTCNMWVVRWFHQQEHFLMKHLPFQLNLSYFTIQDNIFVSSFQRNDRIKSCNKYCTAKVWWKCWFRLELWNTRKTGNVNILGIKPQPAMGQWPQYKTGLTDIKVLPF
jgi:hypothetical protein